MNVATASAANLRGFRSQHLRCEQGFTLVEVMVSLAVLSLILLATVSALRTFANTQGSLERKIGRVDEIRSVSSFLRDALQANIAATRESASGLGLGGGASEKSYFRGTARSVEWKAPMIFGEGHGGIFLVRLAREGDQLTLRWQDPPEKNREDQEADWGGTASRVVIENLEEFGISYRIDHDAGWRENIAIDEAPAMLRLAIKSSGRYWPDLIAGINQ